MQLVLVKLADPKFWKNFADCSIRCYLKLQHRLRSLVWNFRFRLMALMETCGKKDPRFAWPENFFFLQTFVHEKVTEKSEYNLQAEIPFVWWTLIIWGGPHRGFKNWWPVCITEGGITNREQLIIAETSNVGHGYNLIRGQISQAWRK